MTPFQFDHEMRARTLTFRRSLNRAAQCMNMSTDALAKAVTASRKSALRLEAATVRLQRCMESHQL